MDFNDKRKILNKKINNADIIILGCPHKILLAEDYTKYKNIKYIVNCWNKLDKEKIKKIKLNILE